MSASATDLLQKVAIATATTLDAPGYTISDTSITVASTSTWPTDTGITFAIDEVDANGDRVANSYNEYVGVVASGTSVTNVSHVNGTDRNYSAGATTRVYIPVSEERENRIVTWGTADHSQLGAHEIASNFDPSNTTLETQKWVGVASAVNEVTVTNAATGNPPRVGATGDNTNIDLYLLGKGTGSARHAGAYDGWTAADGTYTYASATTFTTTAALAGVLQAGDKIKLTQTSAKYFYVTGVSGTTVTVTGGTDYTLANAAITAPFYSHEENPTGFPARFAYTPTWTNFTVSGSTVAAAFSMHGKDVFFDIKVTLAGGNAPSGNVSVSLPVTAVSYGTTPFFNIGGGSANDGGAVVYPIDLCLSDTTTAAVFTLGDGVGTPYAFVTATAPYAWADTDILMLQGRYKAA